MSMEAIMMDQAPDLAGLTFILIIVFFFFFFACLYLFLEISCSYWSNTELHIKGLALSYILVTSKGKMLKTLIYNFENCAFCNHKYFV